MCHLGHHWYPESVLEQEEVLLGLQLGQSPSPPRSLHYHIEVVNRQLLAQTESFCGPHTGQN
jgi:hypothetical protein